MSLASSHIVVERTSKKYRQMKNIITILFLLMSFSGFAQKYGHLDVNKASEKLPELQVIQEQLQSKSAELESRLKRMYELYQNKIEQFQSTVSTMSADEQKVNAEEIQNLEVRINEAQQNSQIELQELEMQLMKPIFDKVKKAIDDVSVENGYTLIFDTSSGAVLYAGGDDVISLVLEKLAIQ